MYDPYNEFIKNILPNGLEVHSTFWDRPWIAVEIVVHSGGREDPVEMPGLAHFVEHVVSQNIPGWEYDKAKEFFENCGGDASFGSTGYLGTRYKFRVPADAAIFMEALIIFGSMLLGEQIEKKIERERHIILREFNGRYPFHETLEWEMDIRKNIFKGHRLETWNRPLGRPEGFQSVTKGDLQSFYDKHYVPENISLVIVGGLQTNEIISKLVRSSFGKSKYGKRNKIPKPCWDTLSPVKKLRTVKLSDHVNFKADQTEYTATWALPCDFPRQACRVFDHMFRKILFDDIRQKRSLAYRIGTAVSEFQDVTEYKVNAWINPNATESINEIVRECINMIPLQQELFEQKLNSAKQDCLMTDLSGSGLIGKVSTELVLSHRISTIQEGLDDLNKVTFEQMSEAIEFLDDERQYTFIIRP